MSNKILGICVIVCVGVAAIFLFAAKTSDNMNYDAEVAVLRWVENAEHEKTIDAFKTALETSGYTNVRYIEPADSKGDEQQHQRNIDTILGNSPDLIFSLTTTGTTILKEREHNIPIVFSIVTYPQESGLVESYVNSGNNLVGTRNWVSMQTQFEVFYSVAPTAQSIAFVHREGESNSEIQLQELRDVVEALGITVIDVPVSSISEIYPALLEISSQIDSVYSPCDTLVQGQGGAAAIHQFVQEYSLPDFACIESGVRNGSLIGTVADFSQIGQAAGEKAAQILNGAEPSSITTDTVARPFIFINKTRAEQLGIQIPQDILALAKEVIE